MTDKEKIMKALKKADAALKKADAAGNTEEKAIINEDAKRLTKMYKEADGVIEQKPQRSITEELGRQVGLTGRYALEGGGSILDLLATPIRGGINMASEAVGSDYKIPEISIGKKISDIVGLPNPETPLERVVGEGSKFLTSVAAPAGLLKYAMPTSTTGQATKKLLTENIGKQGTAATSAGVAMQGVEEMGGGTAAQITAALPAALFSPYAAEKAIIKPVSSLYKKLTSAKNSVNQSQAVNNVLDNVLTNNNIKLADLSDDVIVQVKRDIDEALKVNPNISSEALRRLIDYRVVGATPKQGTLTLDPAKITKEKNTAKIGANSNDPNAQRLAQIENENNQILLKNLDGLGADKAVEPQTFGKILFQKIEDFNNKQKEIISNLYKQIKDDGGLSAKYDSKLFIDKTKVALTRHERFLPTEFKGILDDIKTGKVVLDVNEAAQIKTLLATAMRSTADGNIKTALRIVREQIENANLLPNQKLGKEALKAEKKARRYTYEYKKLIDSIPALKQLNNSRTVINQDNFFEKIIIRSTGDELAKTFKLLDPSFKESIKQNVIAYLKSKASGGRPNEIANLSGSTLQKELRNLGNKKLNLIFTKAEIAKLKSIGNVASYEQVIPKGAAVNTSNTASALRGLSEVLGESTLVNRLPLGNLIVGSPARNLALRKNALEPLNVPSAIQGFTPNRVRTRDLLSPYTSSMYGSLLDDDEIPTITIRGGGAKFK
tara:strand:+ start:1320 stop:3485 length:2166 start_codon:yes stop_codon:yes gene_type:complete